MASLFEDSASRSYDSLEKGFRDVASPLVKRELVPTLSMVVYDEILNGGLGLESDRDQEVLGVHPVRVGAWFLELP